MSNESFDFEDLVTSKEAAKLLGVPLGTLRNWTGKGIIEPIKLSGKHARYSKKELVKFIESKKAERGDSEKEPVKRNDATLFTRLLRTKTRARISEKDSQLIRDGEQPAYLPTQERRRIEGGEIVRSIKRLFSDNEDSHDVHDHLV